MDCFHAIYAWKEQEEEKVVIYFGHCWGRNDFFSHPGLA